MTDGRDVEPDPTEEARDAGYGQGQADVARTLIAMADAAEKHGTDPRFVQGLRLAATTAEALALNQQPFGRRSLDQIRQNGLAAVAEWEAENGPFTEEEIATAKAALGETDQ